MYNNTFKLLNKNRNNLQAPRNILNIPQIIQWAFHSLFPQTSKLRLILTLTQHWWLWKNSCSCLNETKLIKLTNCSRISCEPSKLKCNRRPPNAWTSWQVTGSSSLTLKSRQTVRRWRGYRATYIQDSTQAAKVLMWDSRGLWNGATLIPTRDYLLN